MKVMERISVDTGVMLGQPIIKGTRLPVYVIVQSITAGDSLDELLEAYPFLSSEDVEAALQYAADVESPKR